MIPWLSHMLRKIIAYQSTLVVLRLECCRRIGQRHNCWWPADTRCCWLYGTKQGFVNNSAGFQIFIFPHYFVPQNNRKGKFFIYVSWNNSAQKGLKSMYKSKRLKPQIMTCFQSINTWIMCSCSETNQGNTNIHVCWLVGLDLFNDDTCPSGYISHWENITGIC